MLTHKCNNSVEQLNDSLSFSLQSQWAEGNLQAPCLGLTLSRQLHLCHQRTVSLLFFSLFLQPHLCFSTLQNAADVKQEYTHSCALIYPQHRLPIFNCCLLATDVSAIHLLPTRADCLPYNKKKEKKSFTSCSINLRGSHWLILRLFFSFAMSLGEWELLHLAAAAPISPHRSYDRPCHKPVFTTF